MPNDRIMTVRDKICRRSGHIAVAHKGALLVWGGYTEHIQETSTSPIFSRYHETDEVWLYDCFTEVWYRVLTKGDIPPRNSGSCGVLLENDLYVFGGYHGENDPGSMEGNSNQLYRLDLNTMVWEWLHPTGDQPAACDKLVGWTYQGKLYFFGGFGPPPHTPVPYQHVLDPTTEGWPRGWNNQLVVYSPAKNEWEWPKTQGPIPTPRAAHAADCMGDKVYIFGGRFMNHRTNDLHSLDLKQMRWSGNLTKPYEVNPEGRSWHSFTFVSPERAVMYGGLNQYNTVLNDCWLLLMQGEDTCWVEYSLPYDHGEPRCWHGACAVAFDELAIHSGLTQPYYETRIKLKDHAEELLVLNFSPKSLLRLCLDAVLTNSDQLESEWSKLPKSLQRVLQLRHEQW